MVWKNTHRGIKQAYLHSCFVNKKKYIQLCTDLSILKSGNLRAGPHYFNAQHYSSFR